MIKTVCTVLGVLFCLVGIVGFIDHTMMGMHLSTMHNIVHLLSGALAIYFGRKSELSARRFCQIFGVVYLLLGLVGVASSAGTVTLADAGYGSSDPHLFKLIPGYLEFGNADSVMHILLGAILAIAGFLPRNVERKMDATVDRSRERAGLGR
jgi:hypothetical protein